MSRMQGQAESIAAQAAKLQGVLQSAVAAIITIDADGIIENVNPATERMFGYASSELVGRNIKILMPEPYRAEHDGYVANYQRTGIKKIIGFGREVSGRKMDGEIFPIHLAVSEFFADGRRYFTGIINDLSDRKHAEEALRESERRLAQSQKMEAVGQLTGGIAHDFNNLLTVILGNLELLQEEFHQERLKKHLKKAQDAAELGARLTDQLLTFSRQRQLDVQTHCLNELVLSVAEMLRRTLGQHIALTCSLSPDLWATRADSSQFQNAIVNLAVNARDAMPNGGSLIIETRNVAISHDHLGPIIDAAPGQYVQLTISDTGTGMPKEVRERAFEPFFTTKEKGRGTGLGRAMVYGFVKQAGGHISIYSEVGHGTTFNVYLPRSHCGVADAPSVACSGLKPAANGRTVLVVEDDRSVRELTLSRFKSMGFQVIEAVDGRSAIDILKGDFRIDLVFTDLIMPGGLSGTDVASAAKELRPGVKILLTSGFTENLINADSAALRILRKPYRQADLAMALLDVIDN